VRGCNAPAFHRRCLFGYGRGCKLALGYAQSPAESAMRIGKLLGVIELAACYGGCYDYAQKDP
jgi:hypothetical protein